MYVLLFLPSSMLPFILFHHAFQTINTIPFLCSSGEHGWSSWSSLYPHKCVIGTLICDRQDVGRTLTMLIYSEEGTSELLLFKSSNSIQLKFHIEENYRIELATVCTPLIPAPQAEAGGSLWEPGQS